MNKEAAQPYCPEHNQMAMFLDLDNFKQYGKRGCEISLVLNALKPWGSIVIRRAYGSAVGAREEAYRQLLRHRFEVAELEFQRPHYKNGTDIRIAVEAMETLHTRPGIKTFVIASGDGDFLSLVHRLRQNHCHVIGLGSEKNSSSHLVTACDVFLFYENIVAAANPERKNQLNGSRPLKVGVEAMKTALRKKNLMPPEPVVRRKILQQLHAVANTNSDQYTFASLQAKVFEKCTPMQISKTSVRNCLRTLVIAGILVKNNDQPLLERRVLNIPDIDVMETAIAHFQIGKLLEDPQIVIDPISMAQAVWDDSKRAQQVERLIAKSKSS